MRSVLLLIAAAACVMLAKSAVLTDGSRSQSFFIYRERIKVIHQILAAECPEYLTTSKRQLSEDLHPFHIEVERDVYDKMFAELMRCRLTPCRTAINLTDSWRMNHDGNSSIKGGGPRASSGRACDIRSDLKWFRFTEDAGEMFNKQRGNLKTNTVTRILTIVYYLQVNGLYRKKTFCSFHIFWKTVTQVVKHNFCHVRHHILHVIIHISWLKFESLCSKKMVNKINGHHSTKSTAY